MRRSLLSLLDLADLTDDERTVIRLYYGLDGLPLPYASKSSADIAAGRDESSPRGTCRAGLAKVSPHVEPRPLHDAPTRPPIDPVAEPWFRTRIPVDNRRDTVGGAWVRAMAWCDGPHGPPTKVALEHWYERCGHVDPDLLRSGFLGRHEAGHNRRRPNTNARRRAAALMEIALHEEVNALDQPARVRVRQPPIPAPGPADSLRLPETMTHPLLMALLSDELSPDELVAAAQILQDLALNGVDVSGRTTLLLRCLRPRVNSLMGLRLERVAVSLSYVAATQGNPHLALEWLGIFLSRVGITDRTFTVLVNTIEAAAAGGYHRLAGRTDQLFDRLIGQWQIPEHQIPFIEHFEARQQFLAARSYRLEKLGGAQTEGGDLRRAVRSLHRSVAAASDAARMAERVLTDERTFPAIDLDGKAGEHGGDLTWPWALAAVACIAEPLDQLHGLMTAEVDAATRSMININATLLDIRDPARLARRLLDSYEGPLDCNRYRTWNERAGKITVRVLETVG